VGNAGGTLTTYSYDANGNTSVINAAGSLTTNTWDIENHITVVQLSAGGRTTVTYDGDGKRWSYGDSVMLREFVWDGKNVRLQCWSQ
jgi:YD repeat-containing protein